MKRCPKCGREFGSEFDYCLEDGTLLIAPGGYPEPDEVLTRVVSRQNAPVYQPAPQSQPQPQAKWIFPVLGVLFGLIAALGLIVFWKYAVSDKTAQSSKNTQETNRVIENKPAEKDANKRASATPLPSMTPPPAPTPDTWNRPTPTPPPAPSRPSVTTSRLKFALGAVTTTTSGSLSEGDVKNYLLACRAGQQLTATIASSDRCITFSNGSTVYRSYTSKGDNTVTVTNRCSPGGSYRLEITVL